MSSQVTWSIMSKWHGEYDKQLLICYHVYRVCVCVLISNKVRVGIIPCYIFISLGPGGGQVVSVLVFYSDDPSSNPAEAYSFFCKICVWKEQN